MHAAPTATILGLGLACKYVSLTITLKLTRANPAFVEIVQRLLQHTRRIVPNASPTHPYPTLTVTLTLTLTLNVIIILTLTLSLTV